MKNRIKECRIGRGLSQVELGKCIGVNDNTISRYEKGLREPTLTTLERIAKVLHVNPSYLVGWTSKQPLFGHGATVYLNDREKSYVELSYLGVSDGNFIHGVEARGHRIHILISSVLYVEEDNEVTGKDES